MAAARLAPVLSATSKMERICNINPQSNRNRGDASAPLDYLNQTPALGLGDRTSLFNANPITHLGFTLLIVRVKLLVARHDFFESRVRETPLHANHDCFRQRAGATVGNPFLALPTGGGGCRRGVSLLCSFSHRNFKHLSFATVTDASRPWRYRGAKSANVQASRVVRLPVGAGD